MVAEESSSSRPARVALLQSCPQPLMYLANENLEATVIKCIPLGDPKACKSRTGSSFFSIRPRESMGYWGHSVVSAKSRARVFSYNKRTMDRAMEPFWPLWHFTESITYVLSTY